jgi:hypothetical protein
VRDVRVVALLAALLSCAVAAGGQARAAQVWGEAYYQVLTADSAPSPSSWGVEQEAGLSLNVRAPLGLEVLTDIVVPLDDLHEISPEALVSQLFVRASPASGVSISAGRQRLNWGTAKIFSPIDLLETRANPLDLRPFLPGVSGFKIDVFPDDRFAMSLAALPASDLRWSRGALRAELLLEGVGLDLGFGVIKYGDAELSDRVGFTSDAALSVGALVLYDELELRWGRESAYAFPDASGFDDLGGGNAPVLRAAAGAMFPVDLGLTRPSTFLVEYFFNGDGLTADEARAFASRYGAWQSAGCPAGAELPDGFASLGGLRRHYAAAALTDIALDRFLLLGVTGIFGIDSMLAWVIVDLEWEIIQGTSLALRYEHGQAFQPDQPTDLLLIPFRNRITLSMTTGYK